MTPRHCGSCGEELNKQIFCPICGTNQECFIQMIEHEPITIQVLIGYAWDCILNKVKGDAR